MKMTIGNSLYTTPWRKSRLWHQPMAVEALLAMQEQASRALLFLAPILALPPFPRTRKSAQCCAHALETMGLVSG